MAKTETVVLEAARARAMACHNAAGLATNLRKVAPANSVLAQQLSTMARTLRMAEALCRSAITVVQPAPSNKTSEGDVQHSKDAGGGKKARNARKRASKKLKKKNGGTDGSKTVGMEVQDVGNGPEQFPETPWVDFQRQMQQTLGYMAAQTSSGSSMGGASSVPFHPVGTPVTLTGLVSRPDLEGAAAHVISMAIGQEDRVGVKLDNGGEGMKVKPTCIKAVRAGPY